MFSRPTRGLVDFLAAALCLWAAAYHTPVGALVRSFVARLTDSRTTARPLLAYYSGGVYDTRDLDAPPPLPDLPDAQLLATIPPGAALGRGVYATVLRLGPDAQGKADSLAKRYQLQGLKSPDDAAMLVDKARADFATEDAAVLAVFAGYEHARYAVERARAEGREPTLEVLMGRLPPTSAPAVEAASASLMLGRAYALSWPVPPGTRVSSPFGWRNHPTLGRGHLHTGVDLSVAEGTAVKAVAAGRVRRASEDAVNGRVVIVDHGNGVSTAYCHNSRLRVFAGQRVEAGDVVSESGNTGRSTGPHLHYQLELGGRPMDPFNFRGARAVAQLAPPLPPLPKPAAPGATGGGKPPAVNPLLKEAFQRAGGLPVDTELPPGE